MNTQRISKVAIVGGGSAGWMAAAVLAKFLGKRIEIVLIESDEISTVGVGEATIPPIRTLNNLLGIKETDFVRATQGTFKLGIQFENWGSPGNNYMHTFDHIGHENAPTAFHHYWLKSIHEGGSSDYWDYSLNKQAALHNKFSITSGDTQTRLEYAYHFDAGLYARQLRKISESFGAKRVEGKVIDVATDVQTGYIKSLKLMSGEEISADFFIDCSGFRGLLIEQTLNTGFEDWSHWLPCDRAVTVQTQSTREPVPYTRSIAHSAGWQWQIPLQHRTGNGLVYSSRFLNDDDAQATLLDNVNGDLINKPRIIQFKTGRRLKQWNKNCVALGLASGFLEPLESTSLHMIQTGIVRLLKLFPAAEINPVEVDEYNRQSKIEFEQVRDFIVLHYHITQRTDSPFWNYCRTMDIPETLANKIELFKSNGRIFREQNELFLESSWQQVMHGQGILPQGYHPIADMMEDDQMQLLLNTLKTKVNKSVAQFPTHQEFIDKYCSAK